VYQYNAAVNCSDAYILGTGDYSTVVVNPTYSNVATQILDVNGGTVGSVDTYDYGSTMTEATDAP